MKKIGVLGAGTWGMALARMLAFGEEEPDALFFLKKEDLSEKESKEKRSKVALSLS